MFDEESQGVARGFLQGSSTFCFDGIEDSVKLISTSAGKEPGSWELEYEFQCRYAGYGDRAGQMLAQVITTHRAQVVIREGKVTHAILDDRWDMLSQNLVPVT